MSGIKKPRFLVPLIVTGMILLIGFVDYLGIFGADKCAGRSGLCFTIWDVILTILLLPGLLVAYLIPEYNIGLEWWVMIPVAFTVYFAIGYIFEWVFMKKS